MATVYCAYNTTDLYLSNSDLSSNATYGTAQGYTCGIYTGSNSDTDYNKSTCTKITILDQIQPDNCSFYFYSFKLATEIVELNKIDTSKATSMRSMFDYCRLLTKLDISNFNMNNVIDTRWMFDVCSNLTTIYSNNFDTSKITNSSGMFTGCTKLVGAVPYNSSKVDATMANYITGYFTHKNHNYELLSEESSGNEMIKTYQCVDCLKQYSETLKGVLIKTLIERNKSQEFAPITIFSAVNAIDGTPLRKLIPKYSAGQGIIIDEDGNISLDI